jgi:hypothetical protein
MSAVPGIPEQGRAGVFGNAPRAGQIETWLRELDFDVVTIEHSGAVQFFEARFNTKGAHP